jgi:2-oxoglutarate ferredoxin oxidoreductase subunit gamma
MQNITIRKYKSEDAKEVQGILYSIIDELHELDSKNRKEKYKQSYNLERMNTLLQEKNGLYYVILDVNKIIGFIFAWMFKGIGNLHWMGLKKNYRGKGIGNKIMDFIIKEFKEKGCYKAELFAYGNRDNLLKLYSKYDFNKVCDIEKSLLGIRMVYMVKMFRKPTIKEATKKIKIAGEGGQGIMLLAHILGNILTALNYNVLLNFEFDAAVRGGKISADIIYSEYKIENPVIEKADILLYLSGLYKDIFEAENIIIDKKLCDSETFRNKVVCKEGIKIPLTHIANTKFGSPVFINMLALGQILRLIGINIEKINIEKKLPVKFINENIEAIRYGFSFRDDAQ